MNLEIYEQISNLKQGENVVVSVNEEIKDTLNLIIFQEETLELELEAVRENRYGFYNRDHVVEILAKLEDKRVERVELINSVGRALLGENFREILDEFGVEFQIDRGLPVIVFFKRVAI